GATAVPVSTGLPVRWGIQLCAVSQSLAEPMVAGEKLKRPRTASVRGRPSAAVPPRATPTVSLQSALRPSSVRHPPPRRARAHAPRRASPAPLLLHLPEISTPAARRWPP